MKVLLTTLNNSSQLLMLSMPSMVNHLNWQKMWHKSQISTQKPLDYARDNWMSNWWHSFISRMLTNRNMAHSLMDWQVKSPWVKINTQRIKLMLIRFWAIIKSMQYVLRPRRREKGVNINHHQQPHQHNKNKMKLHSFPLLKGKGFASSAESKATGLLLAGTRSCQKRNGSSVLFQNLFKFRMWCLKTQNDWADDSSTTTLQLEKATAPIAPGWVINWAGVASQQPR